MIFVSADFIEEDPAIRDVSRSGGYIVNVQ